MRLNGGLAALFPSASPRPNGDVFVLPGLMAYGIRIMPGMLLLGTLFRTDAR
ncbi:hypothetical protein ACIBG7_42660 [Nonomuraea sp. NPDC050328]|uniref:hypothetical protein n=1 Tax=Nonomuraea sp. NPDC050328 TaxID=3364361 RepID=UPI00379541B9